MTFDERKHVDSGSYPTFQLNQPRFDQGTYFGRLRHFLDIIDPRTLLTSEKTLADSIQLLEDFKRGKVSPDITNKELWEAQKIKQAIIHPDTGEKVFMPFRMSGFVPFGAPVVTGLLLPNPTLIQTVFWQWLNQSHNACVNYANRNATKATPLNRFVLGYIGAVSSAVSIAVGLNVLIKKSSTFSPAKKLLIQRFVPFPAVAAASTCNILLMRYSELFEGIEVYDSNDKVIGTSKIAARKALLETAVTRMILPAPILLIPPAVMAMLEKTRFLQRYPKAHLPLNALMCTLAFGGALPMAIALFPQISKVKTSKLESEISAATSENYLLYNKGL